MTTIRYEPAEEFLLTPEQARRIRVLSGYGKKSLAVKMGVTPQTVWRWETGRSPLIGDNAYKLATIAMQNGVQYE